MFYLSGFQLCLYTLEAPKELKTNKPTKCGEMLTPTARGPCTHTELLPFGLHHLPLNCSLLAPFPLLTQLLSAHRLAHPEGSLPDLAIMNMTASLDKPEVQKLAESGEERPEECVKKTEKGEAGKDSDESEEKFRSKRTWQTLFDL